MKSLKLIGAGLLALAITGAAMAAPVYIKITGSTAFRKATYFAIVNSLNTPKAALVGTATDLSGAAQSVIRGTTKAASGTTPINTDVVFQIAWAGSVGGVQVLDDATQTAIPAGTTTAFPAGSTWLKDDSVAGGNTLTAISIVGSAITGATTGASAFEGWSQPVAANSDSLQTSTPFNNTALLEENSVAGGIGIIDFHWVKGKQSPDVSTGTAPTMNASGVITPGSGYAGLVNITHQQAIQLLQKPLPLSQFTGNSADSGTLVALVGRNPDSGTRLAAEAEAQAGFQAITEKNYLPTISSGSITAIALAPSLGDQGYAIGGNVATALQATPATGVKISGKPFILVGYVGKSDKNTAVAGGATELAYNGIPYSDASVQAGCYTFWTNEHMYYLPSASADQQNVLNLVSQQIRSTDYAQSGISISSMGTTARVVEGGVVTH